MRTGRRKDEQDRQGPEKIPRPERLRVLGAEFFKFWMAESVSALGSQVTQLALPLVAALTLHATSQQLGFVMAAETAPSIGIGLLAGAWVDRFDRRFVLIGARATSAALLALIPGGAFLGIVSMPYLYILAALLGAVTTLDVASRAYLTELVGRKLLTRANASLEATSAAAAVVGPGIAGVLIQTFSPPVALLADSASYLASAGLIFRIRVRSQPSHGENSSLWGDIREGLAFVYAARLLRWVTVIWGTQTLVGTIVGPVFILYVIRVLGLDATLLGIMGAAGALGALAGSVLLPRVLSRLGFGRTLLLATTELAVSPFLILTAKPPLATRFLTIILVVGVAVGGLGSVQVSVLLSTLRQMITPRRLLGRVFATHRLIFGIVGVGGAILGGFLGGTIGLYASLVVVAGLRPILLICLALSPLAKIKSILELQ
jgi:MFS family permease